MKFLVVAVSFILTILNLNLASSQDIFQAGPHTVQQSLYLSLVNYGLNHNVDVWAPASPGEFPVLYFVPGVTGLFILISAVLRQTLKVFTITHSTSNYGSC